MGHLDRRILLKWSDLSLRPAPQKGSKEPPKTILKSIGGTARPGKILAVMGPSGSGKTSLLNVLSLRALRGVTGTILMNGEPGPRAARKVIGYVMQKDIFFSHLTVYETLRYTALLRLGKHMTYDEKMERVDDVIQLLGLEKCRNTRIGDAHDRGISGGEMKRLNVGNELLSDPILFFLDEPTSGLDSSNALALVENLVEFAHRSGITVVMSIHQPASQIFHRFDDLLLMMNGNIVYDGPARAVGDYFALMGHHCPVGFNIADYFVDLLSDESLETELMHAYRRSIDKSHPSLESAYSAKCSPPVDSSVNPEHVLPVRSSSLVAVHEKRSGGGSSQCTARPSTDHASTSPDEMLGSPVKELAADAAENAPSYGSQVWALMARNMKKDARGVVTIMDAAQCIGVAFIVSSVWWQCFGDYTVSALRDRVGALYFVVTYWMFVTGYGALTNFPPERDVIAKERSSKAFQISAYFFAKTLSDFPVTLIMPFVFMVIVYPGTGMEWDAKTIFGTFAAVLIYVEIGQSVGSLISCLVSDFKTGAVCLSVSLLSFILVGGYYVDLDNIPVWLSWLRFISFYHYGSGALLHISVGGRVFECDEDGSEFGGCPVTGDMVIDHFGKDLEYWSSFLVMVGWYIFFRVSLYVGLRFGKQLKVT